MSLCWGPSSLVPDHRPSSQDRRPSSWTVVLRPLTHFGIFTLKGPLDVLDSYLTVRLSSLCLSIYHTTRPRHAVGTLSTPLPQLPSCLTVGSSGACSGGSGGEEKPLVSSPCLSPNVYFSQISNPPPPQKLSSTLQHNFRRYVLPSLIKFYLRTSYSCILNNWVFL